jgi:hypothetical protein
MYFSIPLLISIPLRNVLQKETYANISLIRVLGTFITGLVFSVTLVGILFKILSWPGASIQMGIGLVGLLIILIITGIKNFKNRSVLNTRIITRVIVLGLFGLFFIFNH